MRFLIRVADVVGRPVVTLNGDAIAQVKDVVLGAADGRVTTFTLNGRGLLSGPLREILPWSNVRAFGPDAVMVVNRSMVVGPDETESTGGTGCGVNGAAVLTVEGEDVGRVTDVILDVADDAAWAVGYEVRLGHQGAGRGTVMMPVPLPIAATRENVVVPVASVRFTTEDLTGFREAARGLERALREEAS
ncbi:PRC-barrel domain-containing protein [Streptomyces sp. NPDC048603]|uniref:PRC-barrel domain-containing protein n=1 Tax=Streptomyces sp. NPDC048603 TaxID=3365577 RepID=UPI00371AA118